MSYGEAARKHYEELKGIVKSDGWKTFKQSGNILLENKPMNGIAVDCYRVTGGKSPKTPKELADHAIAMTHDDWKKFDPSMMERKTLSESPLTIYQSHSLAWPCSGRDFVMELGRFTDDDGSEYVVLKSTVHPDAKPGKKLVRGDVTVSGFIFTPDGSGSNVIRIVQVDPAGSIPAFVVNSQAASFIGDVEKMMKW